MIKNIIFDFNGTMVFDSRYHEETWEKYIASIIGRPLTQEEFRNHITGNINVDIFRYFLSKDGKTLHMSTEEMLRLGEEKEALYRRLFKEDIEHFHLTSGLVDLLDDLKKKKLNLNIATGANLNNVNFYFDSFNLSNWFDRQKIAYDDGSMRGKPEPDIFLKAMKNMEAIPEETLIFEDGKNGVLAAKKAGAKKIIGIYGDSNKEILNKTNCCDGLIENYVDFHIADFLD